MNYKKIFGLISGSVILLSCAPKSIDPTAYPITPQDRVKVEIPPSCKVAYENAIPTVAVVEFANNTTFDLAKVIQAQAAGRYQRQSVGAGAIGVVGGPGGVGIGYVHGEAERGSWQEQAQVVSRQVNAKLGESAAEAVEAELVNIGGVKIFTRRDLQKVLQEQKLQMSGLIDPQTAVQIGKLSGVRYIVTGAINNINLKWVEISERAKRGLSEQLGLLGTALAAAASTQEGWNLTVDVVIKVIDTQTGEVILSKTVSGREVLGKTPTFNIDTIIGGAKKAVAEALEDIRPEISKLFPLRGYIIQLRTAPDGKTRYALINVGSKHGVKPGQEFYVIEFQEVEDPLTGRKTCDQIKLPVTLVVSNQIQTDKAWTYAEGDKNQLMRIKLGQVVERKPLEGGSIIKKLF